ncbi:hypothetical protein GV828_04335 [Flavobacterium sp. NST-5]|uniref:Signal peptidase n=1 Tax=Flavobacterium ichthyis TaxID=2698827 RepID=A0ABW9Z6V3_9FLAO|nr:hypothetical protein [Flavobacterium ichthyis]NBL64426.1 hypothetical protein [Flavobacterium ichthyis]
MKKIKITTIVLIVFLMGNFSGVAQEPGDFPTGDGGLDPAAAPISDYLWILMILAIYVGYNKLFNAKQLINE